MGFVHHRQPGMVPPNNLPSDRSPVSDLDQYPDLGPCCRWIMLLRESSGIHRYSQQPHRGASPTVGLPPAQMRAFARLPPDRQRELLRQSGAAERLRRLGRTERVSLAGPFWDDQVLRQSHAAFCSSTIAAAADRTSSVRVCMLTLASRRFCRLTIFVRWCMVVMRAVTVLRCDRGRRTGTQPSPRCAVACRPRRSHRPSRGRSRVARRRSRRSERRWRPCACRPSVCPPTCCQPSPDGATTLAPAS